MAQQDSAKQHGHLFDMPPHWEEGSELMHAAALVIGRTGLLLRGETGCGKSVLQRYLREQAAIKGLFTALISDDYVRLARPPARPSASQSASQPARTDRPGQESVPPAPLLAFAPLATRNLQEIYGLGIETTAMTVGGATTLAQPSAGSLGRAVIHLLIDLLPAERIERMPAEEARHCTYLGQPLAYLAVPHLQAVVAADLVFARLSTCNA